MASMSRSANSTITGERFQPRDRESFFDAQRRNRVATWRMSALCVVAAVLMGIPLALVVTPLIYAVGLIVADVVNYFSPLPPAFWRFSTDLARFGFIALRWLLDHRRADPQALAIGVAVMLLPGVLLSVSLWVGIHLLFQRSGVGGALLALKAREPNQGDLKELQLGDVVQEMAIASGLPSPSVMLVDAPGANAIAIGTSPDDARIIVSRRLLDDLSRDELEAVLAHLIASIGNGDLHIAFRMSAVLETCGLLVALINSPFGPQSRRVLWRIVLYGLRRSSGKGDPREAAAVGDLLARNNDVKGDDIDRFFAEGPRKSRLRAIRNFILFPIVFTNFAIKLSLWFFSLTALAPSMALLWRTRRYLADATAVQLTRNPDSLANALRKLDQEPGEIPGGSWASHLFFVSPKPGQRAPDARQRQLLAEAWRATQKGSAAPATSPDKADFAALKAELPNALRAAASGDAQAMERLRSMYQSVAAADPALAAEFPHPDDFFAARGGDPKAVARLGAAHKNSAPKYETAQEHTQVPQEDDSSSVSSMSFIGFHPSAERRLKRLARMGAHFEAGKNKGTMVALIFGLIFAPFFLLVAALLLLLISIVTLASLMFLVIWLAFIHQIFGMLPHA
jgi:Zn-dependent protease with chaperone function